MVKDLGVATVIGEETGGLASCYGDVLSLTLPNSRIQLGVFYKCFVRCGGFDDKKAMPCKFFFFRGMGKGFVACICVMIV